MTKIIEENDPDTLQMLDEADVVWINLWKLALNKKQVCY
jgi:hypothetical protein